MQNTKYGYAGLFVFIITIGILLILFARFYFASNGVSETENNVGNYSTIPSKSRYESLQESKKQAESVQDTVTDRMNGFQE